MRTTAVAERGTDGNFETKLSDRAGGEVGRFTVNRAAADGGADAVLHYAARSGDALHAYGEASVRPTLAWANAQAYSLSKDGGPPRRPGLEWRNGLMRRRGAGAATSSSSSPNCTRNGPAAFPCGRLADLRLICSGTTGARSTARCWSAA